MAGLVSKNNNYKVGARKERKEVLREEAQERQGYYDNLVSTEAGIRQVMETCGAKQRAKLEKKLLKLK